jgi:hypothetical protein
MGLKSGGRKPKCRTRSAERGERAKMKGDDGTTPVEGPVGPVPSPGAGDSVGRVTPHGVPVLQPNHAGSGDPAYNVGLPPGAGNSVGRVTPHGVPVPSHGVPVLQPNPAGSGDPAYNVGLPPGAGNPVGRVTPHGVPVPSHDDPVLQPNHAGSGDPAYNAVGGEPLPRRLRRLHRVWPDRDGNISYFLTVCVEGRARVLDNQLTFARFVSFLCESPERYHWFGRRFVIMPDHIHLIAHMGHDAIRLGQWAKAMKAVVGGLERREKRPVRSPGLQRTTPNPAGSGDPAYNVGLPPGVDRSVGRVPPHGVPVLQPNHAGSGDPAYNAGPPPGADGSVGRVTSHGDPMSQSNPAGSGDPAYNAVGDHEFTRIKRAWRWQEGFHDHKFRTPESEQRKWEYVCLNPVRAGLVKRPEEWPFGGEIFYDEAGGPRLVRGTPSLFETGMLIEEDDGTTPVEGNRPTT